MLTTRSLPGCVTIRAGHSLVELAAVLAALGIALAIATPTLGHALDALAVRAARDAIIVEAARARLHARTHGGAALVIDADAGSVFVEGAGGDTISGPLDITARYRARIDLGGDVSAAVSYDRLGLGRLANRSIRLVRGDEAARLTVSAYGRVRAW